MFLLNSVVCGMTAHGMCGWFDIFESARHFPIEFESARPIRIRIGTSDSNSNRISKLRRLQVRISTGATSHQGLLSLPSLRVGKWVPAAAGKAKAGVAHSDCGCGWTCGCADKTVRSLENTRHTWALLHLCFTTKRRYIKCIFLPMHQSKAASKHWRVIL